MQDREMKVYTIRFQKTHGTLWDSINITGFLNIQATSSSVPCMSQVEISAVSSSSSPGKVYVLSKQTLHNIFGSLIH